MDIENFIISENCNFFIAGSNKTSLEVSMRNFAIFISCEVSSTCDSDSTRTSMFNTNWIT